MHLNRECIWYASLIRFLSLPCAQSDDAECLLWWDEQQGNETHGPLVLWIKALSCDKDMSPKAQSPRQRNSRNVIRLNGHPEIVGWVLFVLCTVIIGCVGEQQHHRLTPDPHTLSKRGEGYIFSVALTVHQNKHRMAQYRYPLQGLQSNSEKEANPCYVRLIFPIHSSSFCQYWFLHGGVCSVLVGRSITMVQLHSKPILWYSLIIMRINMGPMWQRHGRLT